MMRSTVGGIAPAARPFAMPPITAEVLTEAEFLAAIEAGRRVRPLRDAALTRACAEALRRQSAQLRRVPGARVVRGWSPNGTPLPREWGVPIERGEVPIAFAMLAQPWVGYVSIVARAADLPRPELDGSARDRIASALADAVLAEVRR